MYVSTPFYNFDDLYEGKNYLVEGILMRKINRRLPFYVGFKDGNWMITDLVPKPIFTEKLNALIYFYINESKHYHKYAEKCQKYTITKFMLLREIIKISDIVSIIVDLSD